ncbi:ADP-forming succinate--CoA ligase subunit beta [Thiopseudomonas acetoxidans]|uniref:Succinate--CoA ligase [ADP-forming] subunit beta n=1 Tax=Thiopseudomonas acetoxidans TaxID=3041622 RepID=A0ABT7SL98_9GAMM|nr:ADP-forming succinate--CoA ligase subunit beta [Thiopseudomonas sp. CY1220]MDM7856960.1 ADP-forming succinate--CoA ligase subunit beta [Thiopseudomonas sp. CY1220]
MNIHEYQAKQLFADYGLPVARGVVATRVDEVSQACTSLGGQCWVVKTQVHAGGRGKAGGVKLVRTIAEAEDFARHWLGERLVTYQSDAKGQPVHSILIEKCVEFTQELYLSVVVDRAKQKVVFIACAEGGVNIEQVAQRTPEKIMQTSIDPMVGPLPFQGRSLGYQLGLNNEQVRQFSRLFVNLVRLFIERDLTLLEVNPLVIKTDGDLFCLDAKANVDDNALYRQAKMRALRDISQEDPREAHAAKFELNYVALDGNIGCMVNGAGLAMGTMDMVSLYGGEPANFLDVGGSADKARVTEAFKIILSDEHVKAVLVNIFGGIVRCDIIAEGIMGAVAEVGVQVPVVVRLEGNNAELGADMLAKSGLNIIAAHSLSEAAQLVVKATEGQQ